MANITRSISPGNRLTVFTVRGKANADEVIDEIVDFLNGAATPLVLWDFTAGSLAGIPSEGLQRIVEKGKQFAEIRLGGRTGIVCSKEVDYGLARMFQSFAELARVPFEISVFRRMEDARAWLDEPQVH